MLPPRLRRVHVALRALTAVALRAAALVVLLGLAAPVRPLELDARVKWFGNLGFLPEEDLQRQESGTPSFDDNLDLRLLLRHRTGDFTWIVDHSSSLVRGDALGAGAAFGLVLDQSAVTDERRVADLTWTLDEGDNHVLVHRFDRLAVRYRNGPWSITAGRQAVSWGNGLVFQPLDLFNPFAPTTVDQDYKTGDDLLLVERSLRRGGNLQLLGVARRDASGDRTMEAASLAGKLHRFVGRAELELVAGRHFEDRVLGAAVRFPVGGALVRTDVVATRLEAGDWKISGILNVDYSLIVGGRTLYAFAEYFHNAFGVSSLPDDPVDYPAPLVERLRRGELFNLMRNYLAVGGSYQWHPLWSQTTTLIGNLDDGSTLLQAQISHEPGDHQRLELGVVEPLGEAGEEFGGVPVAGDGLTVGGGTRLYLRWAYYF